MLPTVGAWTIACKSMSFEKGSNGTVHPRLTLIACDYCLHLCHLLFFFFIIISVAVSYTSLCLKCRFYFQSTYCLLYPRAVPRLLPSATLSPQLPSTSPPLAATAPSTVFFISQCQCQRPSWFLNYDYNININNNNALHHGQTPNTPVSPFSTGLPLSLTFAVTTCPVPGRGMSC